MDTFMVFTSFSVDDLITMGGSRAWKLNLSRANQADYIVCTRNRKTRWSDGPEEHGEGFLIARIRAIVPDTEMVGRYIVKFKEYALISRKGLWSGDRNPVRYTSLSALQIEPENLDFIPAVLDGPIIVPDEKGSNSEAHNGASNELPIADAKKRLSIALGVSISSIEITIRA